MFVYKCTKVNSKSEEHISSKEIEPGKLQSVYQNKGERQQTAAVCQSTYQAGNALSPLSVQTNNSQTADRRALLWGMEADPEKGPNPTDRVGTPVGR